MRNTNIISQKEYNNSKMVYVHIVKESVTPKKNYVILSEVQNVYTSQKVSESKLNLKSRNKTKRIISDDENRQMIPRKASKTAKEKSTENEGKHNVSLTFLNIKYI